MDPEWAITAVPNGGYVLAPVLEVCIRCQSSTAHRDPIHVTAHFLQATSTGPFEVHVRILKRGLGFTNIVADLVQVDRTRVTTHIIFGVLSPPADYPHPHLTLTPPSPYARRLPLRTHPCSAVRTPIQAAWNFTKRVEWAEDADILQRNKPGHPARLDQGSLEWGAWFEFTDENDLITTTSIPFLADIFKNMPELLPKSHRDGLRTSWFPTMTMTVEFKFPIPRFDSPDHASRTVGLYSQSRFMNDPQGRHDAFIEVWTAPSGIGEGEAKDGWREKQVCLAVSTQMALTLPIEVNKRRGEKDRTKL